MTENMKYCMGCMKEIDTDASVCPHCYYNEETVQHYPCLPKGSVIADRYVTGRVISMANDSITYIGIDEQTEEIVSVHEYFPARIAGREENGASVTVKGGYEDVFASALQSFISMWKAISSVQGQISLPTVRNILDYNGTVYTVCKHTDSISLKAYFEETRKPLTWQKAQAAFKSIFAALDKLHLAGVIHGAISPSSVHVGSDGKLHLTSFSIPECRTLNDVFAAAPVNGFSALELYGENRISETAGDVYSLMALIYYSITGNVPPKATDRAVKDEMVIPSSVASALPKRIIGAFIKGLAVNSDNRIRSVAELYSMIYTQNPSASQNSQQGRQSSSSGVKNESPARKNATAPKKAPQGKNSKKKSKKGDSSLAVLAIGTFTAVVAVCMIVFCVLYTTVLYKNYDIPVLNEVFASFDFLPMNKETVNTDTTLPPQETTDSYLPENRYVTVPDFTSHTYDSITTNATFKQNFNFDFTFEYNDKVAKNAVISQDLVKGESVLAGTTVKLVISRGAEQIELPEVIGLRYVDAEEELTSKGFKVKKILLENDGSHTPGIVEMTDLVAGLDFDLGTEVTLSVWDEVEEETTEEKNDKKNEKNDKSADSDE